MTRSMGAKHSAKLVIRLGKRRERYRSPIANSRRVTLVFVIQFLVLDRISSNPDVYLPLLFALAKYKGWIGDKKQVMKAASDLIITDLYSLGYGVDLAHALRQRFPAVPVIPISGDGEDFIMSSGFPFIVKPLLPGDDLENA